MAEILFPEDAVLVGPDREEDEDVLVSILEELVDVGDVVAVEEGEELEQMIEEGLEDDADCTSTSCSELKTGIPGDEISKWSGAEYGISVLTVVTNHFKLDVGGFDIGYFCSRNQYNHPLMFIE